MRLGFIVLVLYVLTVVAANWAISTFGMVDVGFGLFAPAGVYFAGLGFTLRDLTQDRLGRVWVLIAIILGALLSGWFGAALAVASGVAFLVSELSDFAVYTPLRQRGQRLLAVLTSNTVGLVIDSALFLWLAFGSLDFIYGQIIGKLWITVLSVLVLYSIRTYVEVSRKPVVASE